MIYKNHKKSQLSQKKHPIDFTCCELERRESIFLFKINQGCRVPRSKSQLWHLRPAIFFSPQYLCPCQVCIMFCSVWNHLLASVFIFGGLGYQSPIIQWGKWVKWAKIGKMGQMGKIGKMGTWRQFPQHCLSPPPRSVGNHVITTTRIMTSASSIATSTSTSLSWTTTTMITKIAISNIGNHQLTCQLNSTLLLSAKFATWIFRWKSRNLNRDNPPFVTKRLGGVHQGSPTTAHPSLALNRKIEIFWWSIFYLSSENTSWHCIGFCTPSILILAAYMF